MDARLTLKGNLVLPDRILEGAVVRCENGRIAAIEDGSSKPEGEMIELSGHFIAPGFVDVHVHGAAGADYMDGTREAVRMTNSAHAAHGTTSIFPTTTTGSFAQLDDMIRSCEEVQAGWSVDDGARIAGIHFYGPYFASNKVGVHSPKGRRDPVREEYEYFLGKKIVKIATCAAELPGAEEFYEYARRQGCLVTCGHSNACWAELDAAFAAGMRHVDHFWCAMSSVSSLRGRFGTPMQGSMEQYVLYEERMSTEVIADGIHLSDDLLRFAFKMIGSDRTCLVTDANRAMDAPPGRYRFGPETDGTWVISDGESVRGEDGSLASSMCGMDTMVRTMARAVGNDLPSVIRMASLTPARLTGIDRDVGSIETGKRADFVILTPDLEVRQVFIGGDEVPKNS
ncbi:N-acetylglucosamine-6-phosphate deacetylase [Taklimakanibacter deserti]|uniref:N-acetylglucosamine-6-phosphate deacetylase n=1 Tax=Taklimakanibacter deserti TaxID=2267839 RepID=UPI000E656B17